MILPNIPIGVFVEKSDEDKKVVNRDTECYYIILSYKYKDKSHISDI